MAGRFSADLRRFVERANGNIGQVVRKVVLDLGEAIVLRTPVGDPLTWRQPAPPGYVGGRARGSWNYGYGAIPAPVDEVDASGAGSLARIRTGVESNPADAIHYIVNTVPYMRPLEYDGWSNQAPAGMVRVTIEEFQEYVAQAVNDVRRNNR